MEKRKKKNLLIVIASVLTIAIIILVICLTVIPSSTEPDNTDVPDLGQDGEITGDNTPDDTQIGGDNGQNTGGDNGQDSGGNTGSTPPDGGQEDVNKGDGDKEETPPIHEHDYKTTVVSPTCTSSGYTTYICSGCKDSYVSDYVDATGHTEKTITGTPAGCLRPGKTDGISCGVCGIVLENQTDIEPLGHSYTSYVCIRCNAIDPNMPESSGLEFEYNYSTGSYTLTNIGECPDKNIKIPAEYKGRPVTAIGPYALTYSGAKHVYLPDSITEIQDHAFSTCSELISVNLPAGVSIGESAFGACYKLESIEIPDGTTYIENYAFQNCTSLKSVKLGKDVTGFGTYTFDRCEALEYFEVSPDNTVYSSKDGIIYNKSQTVMSFIPNALSGDVVIPDTVWSIMSFKYKTNLISVKLPNGLNSIDSSLFEGCTSLKSVTIPDGVKTIGSNAFKNCSALESLTIPDSVTSIARDAFCGCTNIINSENGILYVGNWVVGNDGGVIDVVLPDTIKGIADWAFYGCKTLESIVIPDGVTSIGIWAFYNCSALKTITIPESVTSFNSMAFYNCTKLTDIYYDATKASWDAIQKANSWNSYTGNYTIHCIDGDISK
ncbi:MAG: leucine-rich repeat protein [Clostridia bacterium]|nr:leucine-rich repeat protein [Clostridia bacterium]